MKNSYHTIAKALIISFLILFSLGNKANADILLEANFNSNENGFSYQDDLFRGTSQPGYASGVRSATEGFGGSGGLVATVGGVDATPISNMSAGWTTSFSLASSQGVTLSLRYNLKIVEEYEGDEYSQMLVSVDGMLLTIEGNDYAYMLTGASTDSLETGWKTLTVYLGTIPSGSHDLSVGLYNNRKSEMAEQSWAYIDDVVLTTSTPGAGGIFLETFSGISGTTIASLTSASNYPDNPSSSQVLSSFEGPVNASDNYGSRLRGYIEAPQTGNYTFWLATDDDGELWLSSDENPANTSLIANVSGWTDPLEWNKFASQQSSPIALVAGQKYYIEVLQKEQTGGDNVAVGWQGPGITGDLERPIPGYRLTPWTGVASPPSITTQPASQTINESQTATFNVVASGTAPLSYQWQLNGSDIPGATSDSYTTPVAAYSDNGAQYRVVVSNSEGSVTSSTAILTVNALPPVITTQPASLTRTEGTTATFFVIASSSSSISYQWRLNGSNIPGATLDNYSVGTVNYSQNGNVYSVVVTNAGGSVISDDAVLTVTPLPPVITTQPASQTRLEGETATFTVSATSSAPLSYQWRRNGTNVGSSSNSYTTPALTLSNNGDVFSVVVSNDGGSTTSANANLTVNAGPPVIVTEPSSQTIEVGETASFSVTAAGSAPLSYQWRRDGLNIPGETASSYDLVGATLADNGAVFSVAVTNPGGTVVSADALLTVQPAGAVPNAQKLSISGELLDDAGNPIGYPTPVEVEATIRLFTDASAGTQVYSESFLLANAQAITVDDGLFVARLGEGSTADDLQAVLTANDNLWVEITIEGGTPDVLSPRTPLTSAAYSIR